MQISFSEYQSLQIFSNSLLQTRGNVEPNIFVDCKKMFILKEGTARVSVSYHKDGRWVDSKCINGLVYCTTICPTSNLSSHLYLDIPVRACDRPLGCYGCSRRFRGIWGGLQDSFEIYSSWNFDANEPLRVFMLRRCIRSIITMSAFCGGAFENEPRLQTNRSFGKTLCLFFIYKQLLKGSS